MVCIKLVGAGHPGGTGRKMTEPMASGATDLPLGVASMCRLLRVITEAWWSVSVSLGELPGR